MASPPEKGEKMSSNAQGKTTRKFGLRLWLALGIAYGLYLLVAGLLLPYLAQTKLPAMLSQKLQRQVTLEKVRLNPWTLKIQAWGIRLDERAEIQSQTHHPFVSVNALTVDFDLLNTILSRRLSLDRLELDTPFISIFHDETGFNFTDFIAPPDPSETEKTPQTEATPPRLKISAIAVKDAHFVFTEKIGDEYYRYPDNNKLNFTAEKFLLSHNENPMNLKFQGSGGGSLELDISLGLWPLMISGHVDIRKTDLKTLALFFDHAIPAQLDKGFLDFSTDFFLRTQDAGPAWGISNGEFRLYEVEFSQSDESLMTLGSISLDKLLLDSAQRRAEAGTLVLNTCRFTGRLDPKGQLDLISHFTPQGIAEKTDGEGVESTPWAWSMAGVDLQNGILAFTEGMVTDDTLWLLEEVNIQAGAMDHTQKAPIPVTLSTQINKSGRLTAQGEIQPASGQTRLELSLKKLDLSWLKPYITDHLRLERIKGFGKLSGNIDILPDQSENHFTGNVSIENFALHPKGSASPFLSWKKLDLVDLDFSQKKRGIHMETIALDGLTGRVELLPKGGSNLSGLVVPAKDTTPAPEPAAPFDIGVKSVKFKDSALFFSDQTVSPAFHGSLEMLNGEIQGLSSKKDMRATVDIQGKADRYAPVSLTGTLNPFLESPVLDLELGLNQVEMTAFSSYAATYAGYGIDRGLMEASLDYTVENNYLNAKNQVVIRQLELGGYPNSPKATALPVKLAIALIEDTRGVIDLDVPVYGDLNKPDVSVGGLVLKAFVNVFIKALASPFALVGGLIGGSDTQDHIDFSPGKSTLSDPGHDQLKTLVAGLKERPKLRLVLQGSAAPATDAPALSQQRVHRKLSLLMGGKEPEETDPAQWAEDKKTMKALETLYTDATGNSLESVHEKLSRPDHAGVAPDEKTLPAKTANHLYQSLVEREKVSQERLDRLSYDRSRAVKSFLVEQGGIDPARIYLKRGGNASTMQVKMSLSVE